MSVAVLRADARALPLPDASVDLIVTSPPYYALRDYRDGDASLAGQIGSEATPAAYVAALLDCTREWMRVLKPSGSMWINLGDKYSERSGPGHAHGRGDDVVGFRAERPRRKGPAETGVPAKSLLGLPWRYALGCIDDLGLILRAEIIWAKPNGLPESVTDRVRRSHEQVFHFTRQPRYYSAVDEVREAHNPNTHARGRGGTMARDGVSIPTWGINGTQSLRGVEKRYTEPDPLGKLPGSVWEIPSQPLTVPAALGTDHFAAFPMELPRRIIAGWSPPGICVACGEGRRPVTDRSEVPFNHRLAVRTVARAAGSGGVDRSTLGRTAIETAHAITGYACACTPYTDHEGTGASGERYGDGVDAGRRISFPETPGPPSRLSTRPKAGGGREYHFDGWTPPPTRPAIVADPFGGTGTTALVASVLGRDGFSFDRSADYCRLARWRVTDPGERARAMQVPKPPPQADGQGDLFGLAEVAP